ncbi:metal ABC transporter ATP-binding protein [Thiomonas sp.]|jgi:zinc/manganese transport system ATP-binding protein|uniref:metal ABC transporter ATP-binding protein n=1 Tax=Thiomonas sp. TaxID=2047785 RepID=UPI0026325AEB|nr:ABC transporter ATP-binding protein [Thiomonas sp.]
MSPAPRPDTDADPAIAVLARGLRLARGARDVVGELDLRIPQGQVVGLFGSNGAGKTTLLQALAGLLPVREGELRVFGGPPSQARRAIGYVAQTVPDGAYSRLRACDFVASAWQGERWGMSLSPSAGARRRAAVREALHAADAGHLELRGMDTLSGGERQRVCIAQALVNPVRMLLLDEPLANLDPRAQLGVLELVRGLRQRHGLTVLLSAHDINPLLGVMDSVLYLAGGRGRQGRVDEVIEPGALSALYGLPMQVARHDGYLFIHPARGFMAEQGGHCEHGDASAPHAQGHAHEHAHGDDHAPASHAARGSR